MILYPLESYEHNNAVFFIVYFLWNSFINNERNQDKNYFLEILEDDMMWGCACQPFDPEIIL